MQRIMSPLPGFLFLFYSSRGFRLRQAYAVTGRPLRDPTTGYPMEPITGALEFGGHSPAGTSTNCHLSIPQTATNFDYRSNSLTIPL